MTTPRQDYLLDQLTDSYLRAQFAAATNDPAAHRFHREESRRLTAELVTETERVRALR